MEMRPENRDGSGDAGFIVHDDHPIIFWGNNNRGEDPEPRRTRNSDSYTDMQILYQQERDSNGIGETTFNIVFFILYCVSNE